jgi:septal ring factor EnvC (AmiA/AmiB activator)
VRDELVTYARRYWTLPWLFRALIALAILGACLLLFDRCGAWWQNRETERVLGEVAEKNKVIERQAEENAVLRGQVQGLETQIQQKDETIAALAKQGAAEDEQIQSSGGEYRKARRGRVPRARTPDELDRDLRELYPPE